LQKNFPDLELPAKEDVQALSHPDAFTKLFACVQSSWLIIQCIVQTAVGLPITQLELATITFVVCALVMYLLWWDKPFNVERRATIAAIIYDDCIEYGITEIEYHSWKLGAGDLAPKN
jgi:hypothetical protein